MDWRYNITYIVLLPQLYNLDLTKEKYKKNLNWGMFYKITSLLFVKHFKLKKTKEIDK